MTTARLVVLVTVLSVVLTMGFIFFERNASDIDTAATELQAEQTRTQELTVTLQLASQLDSEQRVMDDRLRRNLPYTWAQIRQKEHDQLRAIATTAHLQLNASTIDVDRSVHLTLDGDEDDILRALDGMDNLILPIAAQTTTFTAKTRTTDEVVITGALVGGPRT
jgi:hypothetical protein